MKSNKNKQFDSGAVRGEEKGKGVRYDLISPVAMRRLAETYHEGSVKYSDDNWRKGIPNSNLINHALTHIFEYLGGARAEDDLAHAVWNLCAVMENEEVRPEMNDLYFRKEKS